MTFPDYLAMILIGCGATLVMDAWLFVLQRLGIQTLNFAFIGRWFGHLFRGRLAHASIAKAEAIRHELLLGWMVHYAVGIAFSSLLVSLVGAAWLRQPTWLPALQLGLATVVAPFFVLQPAMGSGIAGARTAAPWLGRLRSIANHAVFGLGLYLSAALIAAILR